MAGYFKDIWLGVSTVLIGMQITFKHWFKFKKAVTILYPYEILEMNERTRAQLFNVADDCGVCMACVRACPVGIITIKGIRADKGEDLGMLSTGKPKQMHLIQFDIDFSKCVYCGLCVEVCETASLDWRAPQEPCTFTREEMHRSFATIPPDEVERLIAYDAERKAKKAEEMAANKAAGKAPSRPDSKPVTKSKPVEGEAESGESVVIKEDKEAPDASASLEDTSNQEPDKS